MSPSDFDWDMMVFCQRIAHAVRRSDNLRIPRNPEKALEALKELEREKRKEGAA